MKVIVTLTSWTKRIASSIGTIKSIMEGDMLPDLIVMNLSKSEFEGIPLPDEILELEQSEERFKINWIDGPNTKTFKKLIPTLEMFPDDIVISIDDDIYYPKKFVSGLVKEFNNNPNHPITIAYNYHKGVLIPWGGGTLYKYEFLKRYEKLLDEDVIQTYEDDWFYAYMLLYNGYELKLAPSELCYTPGRYLQTTYEHQMYLTKTYNTSETIKVLDAKLEARGETFDNLVKNILNKK